MCAVMGRLSAGSGCYGQLGLHDRAIVRISVGKYMWNTEQILASISFVMLYSLILRQKRVSSFTKVAG